MKFLKWGLTCLLPTLSSLPNIAVAEDIQVRIVSGYPEVFRWVRHAAETFIPAVNAALADTDHQIQWNEHYGGTLARIGDELETTTDGLAQIGLIPSILEPSQLAPQNISYFTPFVSEDLTLVSETMNQMQFENPTMAQAWDQNELQYLGGAIVVDTYVLMTNFPVQSLDDLEGRKLGTPGAVSNWLKGTGAVAVVGNLTTYYNDINAGLYDGAVVFLSAAYPNKLHEVAPYITEVGFGAQFAGGYAAHKPWFDGLPADVQTALFDAAELTRVQYNQELTAQTGAFLDLMLQQGAILSDQGAALGLHWAQQLPQIAADFMQAVSLAGGDGAAVLDAYMGAMKQAGATPLRDWDQE